MEQSYHSHRKYCRGHSIVRVLALESCFMWGRRHRRKHLVIVAQLRHFGQTGGRLKCAGDLEILVFCGNLDARLRTVEYVAGAVLEPRNGRVRRPGPIQRVVWTVGLWSHCIRLVSSEEQLLHRRLRTIRQFGRSIIHRLLVDPFIQHCGVGHLF